MKIPITSMVLDVPPAPKFKSRAKVESEHEYDQPLSGAAGMGGVCFEWILVGCTVYQGPQDVESHKPRRRVRVSPNLKDCHPVGET